MGSQIYTSHLLSLLANFWDHLLIIWKCGSLQEAWESQNGQNSPDGGCVCDPPTFLSLSSLQSKLTVRRFKHSKMWKSDRINIPKYLAEDVDICRMQELLKREDERMERLKEELKMLRRRQFNFFISSSTIGQEKGAWSVGFKHPNNWWLDTLLGLFGFKEDLKMVSWRYFAINNKFCQILSLQKPSTKPRKMQELWGSSDKLSPCCILSRKNFFKSYLERYLVAYYLKRNAFASKNNEIQFQCNDSCL